MLDAALICLALNVYFEARSEPAEGQRAVAEVTLRRSRTRGASVCETVFAPSQFSWTLLPHERRRVTDLQAWTRAEVVARDALQGSSDHARGATHFHADYVDPPWAAALCPTTRIGRHVFYRRCASAGGL